MYNIKSIKLYFFSITKLIFLIFIVGTSFKILCGQWLIIVEGRRDERA